MIQIVQGKGKKDRVVPVGKVAAGYLAEYLKNVRPLLMKHQAHAVVFAANDGRPFDTHRLFYLIKKYRAQAHLSDNITTHSLRHTCATEMLKGGANIRHVQELLGHSSIKTTQIYTRVVITDLKKAHRRTAPSERRRVLDEVHFDGGDKPRWTDRRNSAAWRKRKRLAKTAKNG
jgi:integrase/recombinase XerD